MPKKFNSTKEIESLFRRNPGKDFHTAQLVERFDCTRGWATNVIRSLKDKLKITSKTEHGIVYYRSNLPKGGSTNG